MISLSYTTMNAVIHEPHTWLCKQLGLKTKQSDAMLEGLAAHRIIQDHVSGVKINPLLAKLPQFPLVEDVDFDPKMKVEYQYNDKYLITGFTDGRNPELGEILEIKTGKRWSPGDFKNLVQWKLYCLALPEYKKIWLVNTPRNPDEWMEQTIKIFNTTVTPEDIQEAKDFIAKAVDIIEHIKDQQLNVKFRSRWCYYIDCPFGCEESLKGGE